MRFSESAGRQDGAHFKRVRECEGLCVRVSGALGWERHPGTHQVQSPGTHSARPGAHGELRRYG